MPEAILIVDETSSNRKLTHRVLSGAGYNVRSVPDAAAALDAIPEFQPRLVLTELRLEGMDGIALTRRIKEDPRTRQTLVIAVTGCGTDEDRRAALNAGCDDFIVKPIDTRALPAMVQTHLARRDQAIGLEPMASGPHTDLPSWALDLCHDFVHEGAAKAGRLLQDSAPPEEIQRAAHTWAGLGGTFGFPEITRLARQLDHSCRTAAGGAKVNGLLQHLVTLFSQAAASCAETRPSPQLPPALVQGLSGKTFRLVGFDGHDAARLGRSLETAGGQVLSTPPPTPSDLTIAAAGSEETAAFLREFRHSPARPLLLVGASGVGPQVEAMLDSEAFDFAAAPWTAEEILARAYRLLTRRNPSAPRPQPPARHRDRKLRIVLADDDPTVLALLRTTLESYGMDRVVAGEGDQALELMRASPPDAAILDVIMPNMDGLEVLAAIRNDSLLRNVRVLLLSALQQESDIVRALGLGADDYVTKPFSPVEVVARLKRLVRCES